MPKRSVVEGFVYWIRNARLKNVVNSVKAYCNGNVLEVGGGDLYQS